MNGYRDLARQRRRQLAERANWGERIAVPRFTKVDPTAVEDGPGVSGRPAHPETDEPAEDGGSGPVRS